VIAPYDVRQTNFIGGGVNAITKSGTNTLRASAYTYHRNENMRGDLVRDQVIEGLVKGIATPLTASPRVVLLSKTSCSFCECRNGKNPDHR